jgi:hypothetical protein
MRFALAVLLLALVAPPGVAQEITIKAEKLLDRTVKSLVDEAERLTKIDKLDDAEAVSGLVKDLETEILKRKDSPAAIKIRQQILAKRLLGRWKRLSTTTAYEFAADGSIKDIQPDGRIVNQAVFQRFISENSAEYKWSSGHIWHVYSAGPSLLAVIEMLADSRTGDGIVLERK